TRRDLGVDLTPLEDAIGFERELDLDLRIAGVSQADREDERERRSQDRELRSTHGECCDEPDRRERRISRDARARSPAHVGAVTSSAGGVGTAPSTSRTTSSAEIRCTHNSGRSTSRWARAGTATALP